MREKNGDWYCRVRSLSNAYWYLYSSVRSETLTLFLLKKATSPLAASQELFFRLFSDVFVYFSSPFVVIHCSCRSLTLQESGPPPHPLMHLATPSRISRHCSNPHDFIVASPPACSFLPSPFSSPLLRLSSVRRVVRPMMCFRFVL